MPTATSNTASSEKRDDIVLSWTVHLARKYPYKTFASVALTAVLAVFGFIILGPYAAIVVTIAMLASLADFLFPVEYIITREKAECRMLLKRSEIAWADAKQCFRDDLGVKVSPLDRVSRLEAFRGVYLRFNDNEDAVVEAVKSLRNTDVRN